MIKHLLMFRFKSGATESERDSVIAELNSWPARYPKMRNWSLGINISERDQTFTHAFCVEFENEGDLKAYLASEHHEAFVHTRWRPLIESRAIASYAYASPSGAAGA